jgi:hypothetical protein
MRAAIFGAVAYCQIGIGQFNDESVGFAYAMTACLAWGIAMAIADIRQKNIEKSKN